MIRPGNRTPLWVGVIAGLAVLAALVSYLVVGGSGRSHAPRGAASDVAASIPVAGATLAAEVVSPKQRDGAPLLVIPGAWGAAASRYRQLAAHFARSGYQVVVYAQRGLGGSTGEADFGGPTSQRDASAVIDWALAHTRADAHRIGMFGISYGAGISLLAAAHDPRIKAVAALSTWTNLAQSYDQDGTPNIGGLTELLAGQPADRHYDPTVLHLRNTLLTNPAQLGPLLQSMSPTRSPDHYIAQLNRNHPAIMLANAFEDSLLNPRQLLPFFAALTTPKRLELAAGDHGGPEVSALQGDESNATVGHAQAWLDHYVRGSANGIQLQDPIVLQDVSNRRVTTYRSWPTGTAADRTVLGRPNAAPQVPESVDPAWSATIQHAGADSGAGSGPFEIFVPNYIPPSVSINAINRADGLVWSLPVATGSLSIEGAPSVALDLSSTSATATIYLHLYDVAPNGYARLVDFQPYTASGLSGDQPRAVSIGMQPISWTVPAGHHLALVVDTFDRRYLSLTPAGNSVAVSSTLPERASLTVPTAP